MKFLIASLFPVSKSVRAFALLLIFSTIVFITSSDKDINLSLGSSSCILSNVVVNPTSLEKSVLDDFKLALLLLILALYILCSALLASAFAFL